MSMIIFIEQYPTDVSISIYSYLVRHRMIGETADIAVLIEEQAAVLLAICKYIINADGENVLVCRQIATVMFVCESMISSFDEDVPQYESELAIIRNCMIMINVYLGYVLRKRSHTPRFGRDLMMVYATLVKSLLEKIVDTSNITGPVADVIAMFAV